MIEFDPHHRIDLTGPWAGFSFLGDRLATPVSHHPATVVNLRDVVSQRNQRSAAAMV